MAVFGSRLLQRRVGAGSVGSGVGHHSLLAAGYRFSAIPTLPSTIGSAIRMVVFGGNWRRRADPGRHLVSRLGVARPAAPTSTSSRKPCDIPIRRSVTIQPDDDGARELWNGDAQCVQHREQRPRPSRHSDVVQACSPGRHKAVTVRWSVSGLLNATITITSNDPDAPTRTVPATGLAFGPPHMSTDAESLHVIMVPQPEHDAHAARLELGRQRLRVHGAGG